MKREIIMRSDPISKRARWGAFITGCCVIWTFYCLIVVAFQLLMPGSSNEVFHKDNLTEVCDAGNADWVGPVEVELQPLQLVGGAHCVELDCIPFKMSSELDSLSGVVSEETDLPTRRVITWRRIEGIYPNDEEAVMDIISCRHEPSGEECSEEEYEQLEMVVE